MIVLPAITAILIPLASYHFSDEKYNQFNPGIAVEADWLAAGVYRNSFNKTTVFAQAVLWSERKEIPLLGPVRAGVGAGIGTGYRYPVIGGFQVQGTYWNITLVPKVSKDSATMVGFSVRIPIK